VSRIKHLLFCTRATSAVEAAIFLPIFLILTFGITDLGSAMFLRMSVNAAAQSGAAYTVINQSCTPTPCTPICSSLTAGCLSGIKKAMDDATGNSAFCTGVVCSASFGSCSDPNGGTCFIVSANYPYTPILPSTVYSWAGSATYSSTVTVRVQ
jgi:hypothetical protein